MPSDVGEREGTGEELSGVARWARGAQRGISLSRSITSGGGQPCTHSKRHAPLRGKGGQAEQQPTCVEPVWEAGKFGSKVPDNTENL